MMSLKGVRTFPFLLLLCTTITFLFGGVESVTFPDSANGDCAAYDKVMTVNLAYYQSWAIYRDTDCHQVAPEDLDVQGNGYTHVAYSFVSINSTFQLEPWLSDYATEEPFYERFNSIKDSNPGLKTLAVVGGWTFNNPGDTEFRFSDAVATAESRATFAASCVEFCRRYNFDGIDLDWEFPGVQGVIPHGGRAEDYVNYGLVVTEIRKLFDAEPEPLILTVATPVGVSRLTAGFDLLTMQEGVDFFHLMTYNIHTHFQQDRILGASTDMNFIFRNIKYLLGVGVKPNKIVLGLAAYGRTYTLQDPSCHTDGCFFVDGATFRCDDALGFMPIWAIDEIVKSGNYQSLVINQKTGNAELYVDQDLYINYDNAETYMEKYDYSSKSCFRGVMWWSADMKRDPIYMQMSATPTTVPAPTTSRPSRAPTGTPSVSPVTKPTLTLRPTPLPTRSQTDDAAPTGAPTDDDAAPTGSPTGVPTDDDAAPTGSPTDDDAAPTGAPSIEESIAPSAEFVEEPTGPLRPPSGVSPQHCLFSSLVAALLLLVMVR